jgi:hypothetical protein
MKNFKAEKKWRRCRDEFIKHQESEKEEKEARYFESDKQLTSDIKKPKKLCSGKQQEKSPVIEEFKTEPEDKKISQM